MRPLLSAAAAILILAACSSTTTTPTPSKQPSSSTTTTPAAELTLRPGGFGPVDVGLSKEDAIATGLLEAGTEAPVEGCPVPPLLWKAPYDEQLDVQVTEQGTIASIGTWKGAGIKTTEGIGLGSTLAEVQDAYPDASAPKESGYGQSGVIVTDDDKHIGFLFNPPPAELDESDTVTFIEVTRGNEPALMRDGC